MRRPLLLLNLIAWLLLAAACSRPVPVFTSFDVAKWRDDRNGCAGYRALSLAELKSKQEELLGLEEMQIIELLGRPDQNELYKRNQKFYYYWLNPSQDCDSTHVAGTTLRLAIRFNAMGLAKEVTIE